MKRLKTGLTWLWLLTKRLYRRPAFVVLLLAIPALTLGYASLSTEDSGMLTVAVAQEGVAVPDEALLNQLQAHTQLLFYRPCASPEEAETLVAAGKADTAWLFPKDLEQSVAKFVENPSSGPFIRVLVREDSVMLRLARERLSGTTFPAIARQVFLAFVRRLTPELTHLSDAALLERYDRVEMADNLFAFDEAFAQVTDTHYLLSPLRGLLGLVILLCSLATAIYHLRDIQAGTFCRLGLRWRWTAELAGQLVAVLHVAAAGAVCLSLAGLSGGMGQELALWLCYSLCCAAFSMAVRRLLGSLRLLAAVLPAMTVVMLVACPVFFNLNALLAVRYWFPPTYYIYAANQPEYLLHALAYTLICFGVYALAGRLGRKETK